MIMDGVDAFDVGDGNSDARLIRINIEFKQLGNDGNPVQTSRWGTEEYENGTINLNEFLVSVNYKVGGSVSDNKGFKNLMELKVPFPQPLTKQSVIDIFKKIIEDVIQKFKPLPLNYPQV